MSGTPVPTTSIDPQRWELVVDLLGGDAAAVEEFLGVFLADVPARAADLRRAIADDDLDGVERAGHRIRGSAVNVGATRLGDLAGDLETAASRGDLSGAPALVDQLDAELERVSDELRRNVP